MVCAALDLHEWYPICALSCGDGHGGDDDGHHCGGGDGQARWDMYLWGW